jgi:outer membrane protein OmpA-like peptidoglycan-associated protein
MKTSGFLLMAFLCSLISPLHAYDLSRKFGLGVGAGYPIPVWGNPFNDVADPKYQLSAFGRYYFDQSVGMELGASLSKFKKTDWKFKNADVMGLWRMTGATSISPVIGLGAALTDIDNYNPGSAKLSFLGRLGAEMDIGHSLSIGLFADYQYVSKIMGELPTRPAHVIIPQLALTWMFGAESSDGVHEEVKNKDNEKAKEAKAPHSVMKEKEKEHISDVVETRSSSTSKKPDLTVYFDTEKADISAEFSKKLKKMAEKMKKNARMATIIEGHADSTGPRGYNQKLSMRRAEAVKKQLMDFGVSEASLETEGFGEDKPIATNKTKEGRAKNRRSALFISVRERTNVM